MRRASRLLGLIAGLISSVALALPEDRNQPIKITADQAELNDREGTAIYTGGVKLVQGTLELDADQLIIRSDGDGIQHLIATGRPAHYQQRNEANAPLTHGYGLRIEYDVDNNLITFIEQARLERAADTFQGERIQIDTARDVVSASSSQSGGDQRVEMVIQPRNSSQ